ncbi:MAG: pantetheine-phosphate adenylyltransferase [Deltaproteobacteria bacterium]|nr:pantetheine-phosphate adenylyltransferase [Deltaproteobacteria bacterium]
MSDRSVAVYPASFDPITNGHLDLITRSTRLFERVVVAVGKNVAKSGLFSLEERIDMISGAVADLDRVEIDVIDGLLVDYVREKGAHVVIRGLRVLADFEYEFEMAMMNSHMNPDFETVYLMTSARWFFVSSSRLREIASFGADVSEFVPKLVAQKMKEKLARS